MRSWRVMLWSALAVVVGVVVLVLAGRSVGGGKFVARPLLELGTIGMPARLEPRRTDEAPTRVLFHFDWVADSFTLMGSHTPIRERLTIAVWPGGADGSTADREGMFRRLAIERVEDVTWRRDGAFEVGTGIHRVNTHETPAVVLLRNLPEHGLELGYMAWIKDADVEAAKTLLDKVAASYAPAMERDAFFAIVRDRPAKLRAARRAFLAEQLALHGVRLEPDGPLLERDGIVYHLALREPGLDGAWLFAMTPIGSLPASARPFRHHRPAPPDGLRDWPGILYFVHRDGAWQKAAIDRDFLVPAAMQPWLEAQLADPSRAYFFAVHGIAVDEAETSQFGLELLWQAPPAMRSLLAEGRLVFPLP